jgi:hypothetical protein
VENEEDSDRYMMGRNGDNLVTPFQCDLCHFRNLMKRDPLMSLPQDLRMLKLIRRANLDALWSREPSTVLATLNGCRYGSSIARYLGFGDYLFPPMGPFPLQDTFGMGIAIVMLESSLRPGRYDSHVQYRTIRKLRSAYFNVYHASLHGQNATVMAKETRKLSVTTCPTYAEFFEWFMRGMHKRMGEIIKPDRALSLNILKEIMAYLEDQWGQNCADKFRLSMEGAFISSLSAVH